MHVVLLSSNSLLGCMWLPLLIMVISCVPPVFNMGKSQSGLAAASCSCSTSWFHVTTFFSTGSPSTFCQQHNKWQVLCLAG